MEIVPIFVNKATRQGLYSLAYDGAENEWDRLLDLWNRQDYLFNVYRENRSIIRNGCFKHMKGEDVLDQILTVARKLENTLLKLEKQGVEKGISLLKTHFRPLHPLQTGDTLPGNKGLEEINVQDVALPALSFFGLGLEENTFIITGGCINFTPFLGDRQESIREIEKLKEAEGFLLENQFTLTHQKFYYYGNS